jgi:hypothetical protein
MVDKNEKKFPEEDVSVAQGQPREVKVRPMKRPRTVAPEKELFGGAPAGHTKHNPGRCVRVVSITINCMLLGTRAQEESCA